MLAKVVIGLYDRINIGGWVLKRTWGISVVVTLMTGSWCAQAAPPTYHLTDLGTLGGHTSHAEGINASGQVVGYSFSATDGRNARAFLYSGGMMIDSGQPFGGYTFAGDINDSGQVSGIGDAVGSSHGFIFFNGIFTDLKPYGIQTANRINSHGHVSGAKGSHAAVYADGAVTDLGTLGGSSSTGYGINGR